MIPVIASVLLAVMTDLPACQTRKAAESSSTHPRFVDAPKNVNGLTLYNEKGEIVARCGKKSESYSDCKMESGVTLDDLMNALGSMHILTYKNE